MNSQILLFGRRPVGFMSSCPFLGDLSGRARSTGLRIFSSGIDWGYEEYVAFSCGKKRIVHIYIHVYLYICVCDQINIYAYIYVGYVGHF